MYLISPHSLQAPACVYSSSNNEWTLAPPIPAPDNSTTQSAPLLVGAKSSNQKKRNQSNCDFHVAGVYENTSWRRECRGCQPGPEEWGTPLAALPMLQNQYYHRSLEEAAALQYCGAWKRKNHNGHSELGRKKEKSNKVDCRRTHWMYFALICMQTRRQMRNFKEVEGSAVPSHDWSRG